MWAPNVVGLGSSLVDPSSNQSLLVQQRALTQGSRSILEYVRVATTLRQKGSSHRFFPRSHTEIEKLGKGERNRVRRAGGGGRKEQRTATAEGGPPGCHGGACVEVRWATVRWAALTKTVGNGSNSTPTPSTCPVTTPQMRD